MVKYKMKIIDIKQEAKGVKSYIFEKPADFMWEEGAHTHIGLVGFDEGEKPNKSLIRHMSIMTLPGEGKVGITTRVPGSSSEFKNKLSELKIGDEVILFKIGSRMFLRRSNRPIILVSMGVGIATMRPVIHAYVADSTDIPLLINMNVASSGEFIFKEEFIKLENDRFKNYWLNSRSEFYEELQNIMKIDNAIYYIVGSDLFIKDVISQLRSNNISRDDIILDKKEEVLPQFF